MRGLDSTCVVPCESRNCSNAAKFEAWKARPNTAPPLPANVAAEANVPICAFAVSPPLLRFAPLVPAPSVVLLPICPIAPRGLSCVRNSAQLMPD